jgi:CheY-like chemotaxis protein
MSSSSIDSGSGPDPAPMGFVVGRDLWFTSKVTATASDLGYRMRVAGDPGMLRRLIEECRPRLILVDLTAGDLAAPQALREYRQLAGPSAWLVAVGPHVDAERLAAARAAGCQLALPRSKFSADLPALLRRCFDRPADQDEAPG